MSTATITSFCPLQTSQQPTDDFGCFSVQMMQQQVVATLRSLAVSALMCEEEADICLSRDARQYPDLIYAILSNDSDCAIMRGVRWIPASSLELQWNVAQSGQPAVYVDTGMCAYFKSPRKLSVYGEPETPAAAVETSNFVASLRQPVVVKSARCRVWDNRAVMGALSLSTHTQLVNVALLTGNDFTRPHTRLWRTLMPRTPGKQWVDKWALFATQPSQRDKRAEEYDVVKALLDESEPLRRAFGHSRAIYDGTVQLSQPSSSDIFPSGRARAFVTRIVAEKGYGFLRAKNVNAGSQRARNNADSLFFHQWYVLNSQLLSEGDEVEYTEAASDMDASKMHAVCIQVVRFKDEATRGTPWIPKPALRPSTAPLTVGSGRHLGEVVSVMSGDENGLIRPSNGAADVLFCQSNVLDGHRLTVDDEVEFEVEEGKIAENDKEESHADNVHATRIQLLRPDSEESKEQAAFSSEVESMTAALDAMSIDDDDLARLRELIAQGELPSGTLSWIVRDYKHVAVAIEQLHQDEQAVPTSSTSPQPSPAFLPPSTAVHQEEQKTPSSSAVPPSTPSSTPAVAPLSSLILPPVEQVTRSLRAAVTLLCGRRELRRYAVVDEEYKELDRPFDCARELPRYLDEKHASCTFPLLSVPEWPLDYRVELFARPFGHKMAGGMDAVSSQILRSSLPLSLRLPVLASRFMLHAIIRQGRSIQYLYPLLDSLIAMFLVLFALESSSSPSSTPMRQLGSPLSSTVPHLLFVRDSARLSFPIMLAGGLASIYQSVCSNMLNLSQLLRLPTDVIERLPPHRLLHGPLLLSLMQDAVSQHVVTMAASNAASSHNTSLPPPPCVSLDLLRDGIVRGALSSSPTSSSHTLLQAVTSTFTEYYQLCRVLVYAAGDEAVDELKMTPQPQPPISASLEHASKGATDEVKLPRLPQ